MRPIGFQHTGPRGDVREKPFVSVIIPCRNEEHLIGQCLASILASDYPIERLEILVIDGLSEDGTREVVNRYRARHSSISLHENIRKSIPCALNIGIAKARGDVLMRLDAHSTCSPDYISKCVEHLMESDADGVGGRLITVPRNPNIVGKAIAVALSVPFGVGNSQFRVAGRNGAMDPRQVDTVPFTCWKRVLFDEVGRFDERLCRSEDIEFSLRLNSHGKKIVMVPAVTCQYYARSDLRSFTRHAFENGRWAVLPFKYVRSIPVSIRHLIPLAFVGVLVAASALSIAAPKYVGLVGGLITAYLFASLCVSASLAVKRKEARYLVVMPVVFGALHISYGLGSLIGGLEVIAAKLIGLLR